MTSATYHCVLRLDLQTNLLTVVAGTGIAGFSGDNGPAAKAQLNAPQGIAIDASGDIYIADSGNNRIREISGGTITTVAGNGQAGIRGDGGPATSAELSGPAGVAVDNTGTVYIADTFNGRVREVSGGVINTLPTGTAFSLNLVQAVAVDAAGNLYIADRNDVYRYANGRLSEVVFGAEVVSGCPVGAAPLVPFGYVNPTGIAVDSNGNVYIAESFKNCVGEVSEGQLSIAAGTSAPFGPLGDNGPAIQASLNAPFAVAVDSAGNLYIGDSGNGRLRKVSGGIITTIAGGGTSGENGPAIGAQLNNPAGLAVSPSGALYFADSGNARVGAVANGVVTNIAGSGTIGISSDGTPAGSAELRQPNAVAFDNTGNLYIADFYDQVREVSNGVLSTVSPGSVSSPTGVAVDSTGIVYVAASGGVFQVKGSTVTNVLPAYRAFGGIAMNAAGNLYVADPFNNRILTVTNAGAVTVAGTGNVAGTGPFFSGDGGPATGAELSSPAAVAVDAAGNLYIADTGNKRIRMVSGGVITTIAGNGKPEFDGDGAALGVGIGSPQGIAADSSGNVYFSDSLDNLIRELVPATAACAVSVSPLSLTAPGAGASFNITIQTAAGCKWAIQGLPTWITCSGSTTGSGPATIGLTLAVNADTARNAVVSVAGSLVTVTQAVDTTLPPAITPGGVVPVYSRLNEIQPGSWISIFGQSFATTATTWNGNFPQSLGGVSVTIDGKPAYLWYVSPKQINVQAPDDGNFSSVNVVVTTPYGSATSTVLLAPSARSFSLFDTTHVAGVIPTPDGSGAYANGTYDLLGPVGAFSFNTRPAKPGETIELYGVGFGPTNPPVPAGAAFSGSAPLVTPVTATIWVFPATVTYAGITSAGLYQLNIVVPNFEVPSSGDYPVQVCGIGNCASGMVTLQSPGK